MARARKPTSNWASGQPTVAIAGSPQPPNPQASKGDNSAELKVLQDALDNTTRECERVTKELEGRQEAHEEALKAKEDALDAAEEKITRIERELSEAKTSGAKTGDNTYDELIAMRESTEQECKRLQAELTTAKAELVTAKQRLAEQTSGNVALREEYDDISGKLADLHDSMKDKKFIDVAQYQLISKLLDELKRLDPEARGIDDKIVERIAKKIHGLSTALSQARADLAAAGTGVPDHSACQAEIDRLNQRCTELGRIKDQALGEKNSAVQSEADLQQKLQEANDRASREEYRVNTLDGQLEATASERDQFEADIEAINQSLVVLDPDPTASPEERINRINARINAAVCTSPLKGFREPLVILAMVGLVVASLFGMYAYMSYRADQFTDSAVAAASASTSVPEELPNDVQPEPTGSTVQSTIGAPATIPETCYAVDKKVISLFFGQDLKDGKIFGHVPSLKAWQKRIKCDEEPAYDEANKQTDISGCRVCIPVVPGVYNATDLMGMVIPEKDATCYVEPKEYRFHNWPRGKSIRFDCSKGAPYDAVRNCRDVSGCTIIIPDPTAE